MVNESSSIDEVQRWKVGTLKEYCSRRGLPISGKHKVELVALAYAATVIKLPCVISKNEECALVAAEYQQLLAVAVLPDPLTELTDGWPSQEDGIQNWPPCMYPNISTYLIKSDQKYLLSRLMSDYKEGLSIV